MKITRILQKHTGKYLRQGNKQPKRKYIGVGEEDGRERERKESYEIVGKDLRKRRLRRVGRVGGSKVINQGESIAGDLSNVENPLLYTTLHVSVHGGTSEAVQTSAVVG